MVPKPGPEREATNTQILRAVRNHYSPAVGASEVAERIEVSRQTVDRHLRDMDDEGLVNTRKIGRVRVWWLTDDGRLYLDEQSQ